jgi:hypothetical protein
MVRSRPDELLEVDEGEPDRISTERTKPLASRPSLTLEPRAGAAMDGSPYLLKLPAAGQAYRAGLVTRWVPRRVSELFTSHPPCPGFSWRTGYLNGLLSYLKIKWRPGRPLPTPLACRKP